VRVTTVGMVFCEIARFADRMIDISCTKYVFTEIQQRTVIRVVTAKLALFERTDHDRETT
jgi:hypothetical protein